MNTAPPNIWRNPVHLVAFGFGSGLSPIAPGTAGTAVALLIYLPLSTLSPVLYASFLLLAIGAGVWLCGTTARDVGVHDHAGIVWDEFTGYWLTMFMAPAGWQWIIIGFLLFRLLDVVKPLPIRWVDRHLHGGTGIMLDDLLAGIMAALCMQAMAILFAC